MNESWQLPYKWRIKTTAYRGGYDSAHPSYDAYGSDGRELKQLLEEGWEPFSSFVDPITHKVHIVLRNIMGKNTEE